MDNNQNNLENNTYTEAPLYTPVADPAPTGTNGFGIASLVLGIFGVLCCCCFPLGGTCAILALVFTIISRKKLGHFDGLSIAGLVLSVLSLVLCLYMILSTVVAMMDPAFWEEYYAMLEELEGEAILRLLR